MHSNDKIVKAIQSLTPGAEYVLRGGVLEWLDKAQTEPTQAEIDAEIIRQDEEYTSQAYARKRAQEYPELAEQLDLLWHAIDAGTLDDRDHRNKFYSTLKTVKTNNPKG